jgi:hypothetical protein
MRHAEVYEPEAYVLKQEKNRVNAQKYRDAHPEYADRMRAYSLQHKETLKMQGKERDREVLAGLLEELGFSEGVKDDILRPVDRAQLKR